MLATKILVWPVVAVTLILASCSAAGPQSTLQQPTTQPPPSSAAPTPGPTPSATPSATTKPRPVVKVVHETPTKAWKIAHSDSPAFGISPGSRAAAPVEGYADQASVAPGHPVRIYVSTSAKRWRATAYRMGWYDGSQGASVWQSGWRPGRRQPRPRTVGATHTPTAPWKSSLTVATTGWRPGSYLIRLEIAHHASYIPLTVRSPSTRGRLVLLAPDTTWQAYNDWGGRNLYWGPSGKGDYPNRARAVTFDRPYAYGKGAGEYLKRMQPVVALAERLKLKVAYADDVDLDRDPHLLDGANGVISMGHDEYYSVAMRANLTKARDAGTNIAFLGANAIYRRIRLESTSLGQRRRVVNYKEPGEDPRSARHPSQTTADWPKAPAANPESSLTGEAYACFPAHGDLVVAKPSHWLLAGTGLKHLDRIPGALGAEIDQVDPTLPTPHPIEVLLQSAVANCGAYTHSDAAYYTTKSGAGVFNSGTMSWVEGLGGGRGAQTAKLEKRITTNLLRAFARPQAGAAHPVRNR